MDLGDEELLHEYARSVERRVGGVVGALASLAMLGACLTCVVVRRVEVVAPLLASGLLVLLIMELLPRRRAVLARFFPALRVELAAAGQAVAAANGTLAVALFRCRVLPHGGTRWLRLELVPGATPRATAEASFMGDRWEEDPLREVARARAELDPDRARHLAELVTAAARDGPSAARFPVRDGAPFELAIVEPGGAKVLEGNLAALHHGREPDPAYRLAAELLALTAEVTGRRSFVGSTDTGGGIDVREV